MYDLHALSSGGSTGGLGAVGTILLGGDGQTAAGVPLRSNAVLRNWGLATTIADTIEAIRMRSQDQIDPVNGSAMTFAASLIGIIAVDDFLPYKQGARAFDIDQNTGAANAMAYTLDHYPGGSVINPAAVRAARQVTVSQVAAGAVTAITWYSQAFAPTTLPPQGRYALLGVWQTALTNYGLIRFAHADFAGYKPGFPVQDHTLAVARGIDNAAGDIFLHNGYQFAYLGECPVFRVSGQGTGLTMEWASITGDTPRANLNLRYLGP